MGTSLIQSTLGPLLEYLDGLRTRAPVEELDRRLQELRLDWRDVAEFEQYGEKGYRRNLIRGGEWYHLLLICWRSGQRSPIHNHAESTCGLTVLKGVATETKFDVTPSRLVKAVSSRDLRAGEVCSSRDADIHQVSNLQEAGRDLVTLHIYSPPLLRMKTYSLTDRLVGDYVPEIFEHAHGSGI